MELPDFDSPKTGPEKPPEVAVVGVGQPSSPVPPVAAEPVSNRRKWLNLAGIIIGPLILGFSVMLYLKQTPTPPEIKEFAKTADGTAGKDGQALVVLRERERVTAKYVEVRDLLARSRKANGATRDVKNLEYALAQVDPLIRMGAFDKADVQLEKIKGAVPPVSVNNPLDAPPKPIDVKAPPKITNEDPTPVAPASAQRRGTVSPSAPTAPAASTAPAPAKKKKPVRKRRR